MAHFDKSQRNYGKSSVRQDNPLYPPAEERPTCDLVDLATEPSFPASEPPAWTPFTGIGAPVELAASITLDDRRASKAKDLKTARRMRNEDNALTAAKDRLEAALAMAGAEQNRQWHELVMADVSAVREALERHASSADGPDGLIAQIDPTRQTLVRGVDRMRGEHANLLQQTEALLGQLQRHCNGGLPNAEENWQAATQLLDALREHQANEDDLIFESSFTDIGVGD
jgi:hypothetical protein